MCIANAVNNVVCEEEATLAFLFVPSCSWHVFVGARTNLGRQHFFVNIHRCRCIRKWQRLVRLSCVRLTLVSRVVSNRKGLRRDSCWRHQLLWCLYRRAGGPTTAATMNLRPDFTYYRNAVPPYTRDKTLLRIRSIWLLDEQNSSTSFCPLLVLLFVASSGVENIV